MTITHIAFLKQTLIAKTSHDDALHTTSYLCRRSLSFSLFILCRNEKPASLHIYFSSIRIWNARARARKSGLKVASIAANPVKGDTHSLTLRTTYARCAHSNIIRRLILR